MSGKSDDPCDVGKGEAIEKRKLLGSNRLKIGTEAAKSYGMQVAFYLGDIEKATKFYDVLNIKSPDLRLFQLLKADYFEKIALMQPPQNRGTYLNEAKNSYERSIRFRPDYRSQ